MADIDPTDVPTPTSKRNEYRRLVLSEAHRQGLMADQMRVLNYYAVGAMAGVDTKPGHEPNYTFFYENIRRFVANTLDKEVKAAETEAVRLACETTIRALEGYDKAVVTVGDDGEMKIDKDPEPVEGGD